MKEKYLIKIYFLLLLLFSVTGYSQFYEPVSVTGFNYDGVAEASPTSTTTNVGLDNSDNIVYSKSYATAEVISGGLPDNGTVYKCFDTYQFAPYNQNNVLHLGNGEQGTLQLATPKAYTSINVAGFATNGTMSFDAVIYFTDGTSQATTGYFPDWDYIEPTLILQDFGRRLRTVNNTPDIAVHMHTYTLPVNSANQSKLVNNIVFTGIGGSNHINVMAVSGIPFITASAGQCGAVVNYNLPRAQGTPTSPKLLLLGTCPTPSYMTDVQAKLVATGMFSVVDTFNTYTGTPTLALVNQYDCILAWTQFDPQDKITLGNILAQYIDEGGGVVDALATTLSVRNIGGNFDTVTYRVINATPNYSITGNVNLGSIAIPAHPVMQGVSTFALAGLGYYSQGLTLANNAYEIARYNNNELLIGAKENVGLSNSRRATLNFFPFSTDGYTAGWNATTDGAKIMANALKWVARGYTQTAGLPNGSLFPVGITTNTFNYYDSNNALQTCSFDVVVKDTEVPVAIAKNINVTLDALGAVTITGADVNDGSTDNCSSPVLSIDVTSFDCTNVGPNTVTLTATDASGNTSTATAVVTVQNGIVVTPSQTDVLCYGNATGEATVAVTGGSGTYTYSWDTIPVQTTATATGLVAGTYIVTITDGNGCTATQSFTITEPASALVATAGPQTNVLCYGNATGQATVNATGGTGAYAYSWNTIPVQTTATATNLTAGTYTATVTDANNCTATQSFTITEPASALAFTPNTSQVNVFCHGNATGEATVAVTGGTGAYTYLWNTNATTNSITGLIAGTYTVDVTDANGCIISNSFTITEPTLLAASAGVQTNILCHGEATGEATVNVTGGTGAYTYNWDTTPVQTTATATGLVAGTYVVTVTDVNNCTTTQVFTITEPAQPLTLTPNTNQTNVLCHGEATGSATVSVTGGTGAYTYLWSNGATTNTITGLIAGTYTVDVIDANGCVLSNSFTITEPALALTATADSQTNVLCYGNATGSATVAVTGGTGVYTYSWDTTPVQTTATATNLLAGTYTVTVTDANSCTTTQSFVITEPAQPLALTPNTTQTNVLCNGQATGSATVAVNGGTGAYTYLWSNNATTNTITGLVAGTYTVTVTDANGCTLNNSFTITEPTALEATASAQTNVLCYGNATGEATVAVAGGTGAYTYSWDTTPVQTTATATGLVAGTYIVTVTDANQCVTTQSFTISQPSQPLGTTPNTTQTNVSCFGGSNGTATIAVNGGTAPYTYLWSNAATTSVVTGLTAGIYTVDVTDANGCTLSQSFTIIEPTLLVASSASQTNVSCFGAANGSATVTVTGGTGTYTYSWSTTPVQTTATATALAPGNYTVTVTDANQCQATQMFTITEPQQLTVAINNYTDILCYGAATGSASATVSGGTQPYTYLWNTGQTTAVANNLTAGAYTVVVTDANGCQTNASITLTQPASPLHLTTSQVNVDCASDSDGSITINATGGTGPYTYTWSPAVSTTNIAENLAVGNYNVVVTDANGCWDIRYLTITAPTAVTGYFTVTNADCYTTGSAVLHASGGVAPYTYLWSNGNTTANLENVLPGTYTVTITDTNGCTYTLSTTIYGTAPIIVTSAPQSVTVDGGATVVFTVQAQNVMYYQWQVSTDGGQTFSNLNGGGSIPGYNGVATPMLTITNAYQVLDGYQYRVILMQQNGCYILSEAATLNVNPLPPVTGIDDIKHLEMSIYPNPASTEVFVKIPNLELLQNARLELFDLNGRLIKSDNHIKSDEYRLDVTGLESGIYIISITADNYKTDKKLIVNKKF